MNFQKYFKSTALISNPLCGIDTYKDVINLATGQITRAIKKLVLTGNEPETVLKMQSTNFFYVKTEKQYDYNSGKCMCTHYINNQVPNFEMASGDIKQDLSASFGTQSGVIVIKNTSFSSLTNFKSYLAQQYANGTPVTIWYVLAESTTEQIIVPSGLSGTVEGYLTQTGTPTPTDPIYPVANNAVGWYGIKNYVRATTWTDGSTYSRSGGSWSSSVAKKRSRKKK